MAFRVNSIVCVMRDWLYSMAADSLSAFRRSVTCQRQKYSKDIIGPVAYYTEVNSFATTLPVRLFFFLEAKRITFPDLNPQTLRAEIGKS